MKYDIPFNKAPFFEKECMEALGVAFESGKVSGDGINTRKCGEYFSSTYGYERILFTPSCTASLEMAALLLDIEAGDQVIVPSFTFVTSASAFSLRGAEIVFADSNVDGPDVSIDDILAKVTEKTKAIVVVHYAGLAVDVDRILKATCGKIPVVEDCAHAIDSKLPWSREFIGKSGSLSTFSFHETKNLGVGEGGALVVNDKKLWRKAQIIREKGTNRVDYFEGKVAKYSWVGLGSSYLMSDIDAAVLWSMLQNKSKIQEKRLLLWDYYDKLIVSTPNSIFKKPVKKWRANAHMYFLEFADSSVRSAFCSFMANEGVLVTTHYLPLDLSDFALKNYASMNQCLNAAKWSESIVRLPLFYDLSEEMLKIVCTNVNSFVNRNAMLLIPAVEEHWDDICKLRNQNRECFANSAIVQKNEHWAFMKKHSTNYRVAICNGQFLGFIGHVQKDLRIACCNKGCGVGKFMFSYFIAEVGDLDIKVLKENEASLRFFEKLGYIPCRKAAGNGCNPLPLVMSP